MSALVEWFETNKRDLPWRHDEFGAWGVLVSEVMLQQTPVARVIPQFHTWLTRWPQPADLAAASLADAIGAWGRLGYPRRAKRLFEAATVITEKHDGVVPSGLDDLLALPGVGDYTARAVRCFAFGIPEPVVDINVRRVIARAITGDGSAGPPRLQSDRALAWEALADLADERAQCVAAAGLMELGAVLCQARVQLCDACPLRETCAWRRAGYPEYEGPLPTKQARFEGSDRQIRGIILRELRHSDVPVPAVFLENLWPEHPQYQRARDSLLADGLIRKSEVEPSSYELPS
jgi:A/G-specific adenine glycosylase